MIRFEEIFIKKQLLVANDGEYFNSLMHCGYIPLVKLFP